MEPEGYETKMSAEITSRMWKSSC